MFGVRLYGKVASSPVHRTVDGLCATMWMERFSSDYEGRRSTAQD